ncbi:MAG TPA: tyrosine-type recombinase/integrase [Mycobacterium sp.]|nr:tyrosine-type recombinase/integrase [Mycobacterium sp.]
MTQLIDDYRNWLVASGASPDTVRARCNAAKRLLAVAGTEDPTQIKPTDLVRVLASVEARWSKATYFHHAKNFGHWCHFAGLRVNFTEGVVKPKRPRKNPHPADLADFRRAVELAKPDEAMMLLLAAYAGLRVHEIAKVRGEHLRDGWLFLVGKGSKDANIPVHPVLALQAENWPSEGWWFPGQKEGQPISRGTVWRRMTRALRRANPHTTATPHAVRALYATMLVNLGVDLQTTRELMRHSDLGSTQFYVQTGDERLKAAIGRLPDFTVA